MSEMRRSLSRRGGCSRASCLRPPASCENALRMAFAVGERPLLVSVGVHEEARAQAATAAVTTQGSTHLEALALLARRRIGSAARAAAVAEVLLALILELVHGGGVRIDGAVIQATTAKAPVVQALLALQCPPGHNSTEAAAVTSRQAMLPRRR